MRLSVRALPRWNTSSPRVMSGAPPEWSVPSRASVQKRYEFTSFRKTKSRSCSDSFGNSAMISFTLMLKVSLFLLETSIFTPTRESGRDYWMHVAIDRLHRPDDLQADLGSERVGSTARVDRPLLVVESYSSLRLALAKISTLRRANDRFTDLSWCFCNRLPEAVQRTGTPCDSDVISCYT